MTPQASVPEPASVAPDRKKPYEGKLTWIPIASGLHPDSEDHLVYWNPCDGCCFGYWDAAEGFMYGHPFSRRYFTGNAAGEQGPIRVSETHYAVLTGPEPAHDINVNWKLYRGDYKAPNEIEMEALDRLETASGRDLADCIKALRECDGDEDRALAALQSRPES